MSSVKTRSQSQVPQDEELPEEEVPGVSGVLDNDKGVEDDGAGSDGELDYQREKERLVKVMEEAAAKKEEKRQARMKAARREERKKELDALKEQIRRLQQEDSEEEEDTYMSPSSVRFLPAEPAHHRSPLNANSPTSEHQRTGASETSHDTRQTTESLQEMMVQQRRLIDAVGAPKLEIQNFNGDPLQYYPFVRAFEENIERVVSSETSRLTRLVGYCTGQARKALAGCEIMEPRAGYAKARRILKERFGDEFTIAQAWTARVTEGAPLRGGRALLEYSDELETCRDTLESLGCAAEMGTQATLQKLVSRLPSHLIQKWRTKVVTIKTEHERRPALVDLIRL